jgi:cytochrome P450
MTRDAAPATLPDGPRAGRLAQTVALHRDPLGFVRSAQDRFGDAFTVRLATTGPIVVLTGPEAAAALPPADPALAHAGAARRAVLPMASPRSIFGGDGAAHDAARARVAQAFTPAAIARRGKGIASIARAHVGRWPRGRPFRLLPRMRALADEIFVRELLGVEDPERAPALIAAIGSVLWTPGNPPTTIPGPDDGLLGRVVDVEFRRRRARVAAVLEAEIAQRRGRGQPGPGVLGLLLAHEPARTPQEIVDELLVLLMAAQEPMAAALTWVTLAIARQRDAADDVVRRGLDDEWGGAVIDEALRLHPPAVAVLRRLTAPLRVGDLELAAGATTMVPIAALQRDERMWDTPDAFRPQRHLDGSRRGPLLPFGAGARGCLGEPLARAQLRAVVPLVLGELRPRPVWPTPERTVLRGTILVPQRSGLVRATVPGNETRARARGDAPACAEGPPR